MKKLRLIKPWDLRIVRQKLNHDLRIFGAETIDMISCQGPAGPVLNNRSNISFGREGAGYCYKTNLEAPAAETTHSPLTLKPKQ